jgi:hypothetical protein
MKRLIIIAVAAAYLYAFKKENQLRKYEQLDHGEEMK